VESLTEMLLAARRHPAARSVCVLATVEELEVHEDLKYSIRLSSEEIVRLFSRLGFFKLKNLRYFHAGSGALRHGVAPVPARHGAARYGTSPRVAAFTLDALPCALHCTAATRGDARRRAAPHGATPRLTVTHRGASAPVCENL